VLEVINENCVRTVVNLGAGLDTRPWRMDLPQDLRWIEVDFPAMLDYKAARLGTRQSRCRLEKVPADLSDPAERGQVLKALGKSPSLMLTEGLLMYLSRQTVTALASEPADQTGVRWWIADISAIALMRHAHGDMAQGIESVRAENHLEAPEILDVAHDHGWKTAVFRSYVRDSAAVASERILKMMDAGRTPPEAPPADDPSGVYLLER